MGKAAAFWNLNYSSNPFSRGKDPSIFLVQMLSRLQKGLTLDIAMGEGQNAIHLAKNGFTVKGFDISDNAIEHAQSLASENQVSIETTKADLDLYILELMTYESIVMFNFKPGSKRFYSEIKRALKQGGTLIIQSELTNEQKEPLGPEDSYKDHYYNPNEILHSLSDLRILFYNEGIVEGKHVVQCLAQKPLDKDAAKYNLFNMNTPQQNKESSPHLDLAESLFKKK